MRARLIKEYQEFKRGQGTKKALDLGFLSNPRKIAEWISNNLEKSGFNLEKYVTNENSIYENEDSFEIFYRDPTIASHEGYISIRKDPIMIKGSASEKTFYATENILEFWDSFITYFLNKMTTMVNEKVNILEKMKESKREIDELNVDES